MIAITIINVRTALEEQVYGEVRVTVTYNDTLYVSIINNGNRWNWYIDEISEQLHNGVTAKQISEWCMKAYRKHICSIFLKNR